MITRANRDLVRVADQDDGREWWLDARRRGLGGSDMAAILGEDPYKGPIDVWLSKVEGLEAKVDKDRTDVGNLLEPVVLTWYAAGGGAWPYRERPSALIRPPTVAHKDRAWQRGSADALVVTMPEAPPGSLWHDWLGLGYHVKHPLALVELLDLPFERGVEVKTHGWWAAKRYQEAEDADAIGIPGDKRIQVAWYQELYDLDLWDLVALVDTHQRKHWTIHRDPQLGADLLAIGEAWWHRHVVGGVAPEPDGSKHYAAHLRRRFAQRSDHIVTSTPELDATAGRLRRIKRLAKRIELEEAKAAQRLQNAIGDAAGIDTAHGKITYKEQRGNVSYKSAIETLIPNDEELRNLLETHRGAPHRVMRTPPHWTK